MNKDYEQDRDEQKTDHQETARHGPVQFQIEEEQPVRAIVLVPHRQKTSRSQSDSFDDRPVEDRLEEALGLAEAIDLDVLETLPIPVENTRPATLFGTGKVEDIKQLVEASEAELVIVDHALSPGQQRNLERAWDVKILDRTGLILEIFGRRAATREGRLQVELAHLTYQKSRLVRSWTHLERQRGGRGFLGGPGETQLEADKRQLQSRILSLTKDLEKVRKTRELHRNNRRQVPYPIIALVGYTNAGKSTLFNRLTGADVMAEDQLFATLDPTMRSIILPSGTKAIISDTVGFVSNLPTQLVAAFRATLEEVLEADIILHVEDASDPTREQHREDVLAILKDLGVNSTSSDTPIIDVWNKIDRLDDESDLAARADAEIKRMEEGAATIDPETRPYFISAATGTGVEHLRTALDTLLAEKEANITISLPPGEGRIVNWLYKNGDVTLGDTTQKGETEYRVTLPRRHLGRLSKMLKSRKLGNERMAELVPEIAAAAE